MTNEMNITKKEWIESLEAVNTSETNQKNFIDWIVEQEEERLQYLNDDDIAFIHIEFAKDLFSSSQGSYKYEKNTHFTELELV